MSYREVGRRVAVVHDFIFQRGGSERVTIDVMRALDGARLVAGSYQPDRTFPEFAQWPIETSWINKIGAFRADPRRALPLLAPTYSSMRVSDVDLVFCCSAGWSHGIDTDAPKIVYCHNPPRWVHQRDDYFAGAGAVTRRLAQVATTGLKGWDRRRANTATAYLANSNAVRDRVWATYGIDARVLWPSASLAPCGWSEPIPEIEPGFLLTVARPRGYKNSAAVVAAVAQLPAERLVVVGCLPPDLDRSVIGARLIELGDVTDAQLRWLYESAAALVAVAHEDFGLTPVEAFGFGLPVLALRAGGYLDTCVEGLTGYFIEDVTVECIAKAVRTLRRDELDPDAITDHSQYWAPGRFRAELRGIIAEYLPAAALEPGARAQTFVGAP